MGPGVDVVIPSWDRGGLLRECLLSLRGQEQPHEVYVVDNGSTDGTEAMLLTDFPEVHVIALPENIGFGQAVNRGAATGTGEILVLLNNDTVAPPGFLTELVAPLIADPELASVAGVLVRADGSTVDAAGVVMDGTLAGYSHLHGRPLADVAGAPAPLGPCGGAAAYRRSVFDSLGGFDPEIFAYSEDLDLALRARRAGHGCVIASGARVTHHIGGSLAAGSRQRASYSGWARGYLLGRYRLAAWAVALEAAVSVVDALRSRSLVPVVSRARGFRRGRALPARPVDRGLATLTVGQGLLRRARA